MPDLIGFGRRRLPASMACCRPRLGVIRGDTAHYDIVCNNAKTTGLMQVAGSENGIPLGNAILTV